MHSILIAKRPTTLIIWLGGASFRAMKTVLWSKGVPQEGATGGHLIEANTEYSGGICVYCIRLQRKLRPSIGNRGPI